MEDFWTFFSFPLNLLLAVLWVIVLRRGWKHHRDNVAVRFLLSPAATVSALLMLLASCLWIGLSGSRDFVQSIVFVAVLLYLQTVLLLIIFRGWRRSDGRVRWRFLLIHAGLLLAVGLLYFSQAFLKIHFEISLSHFCLYISPSFQLLQI